jgi:hypothetical protein
MAAGAALGFSSQATLALPPTPSLWYHSNPLFVFAVLFALLGASLARSQLPAAQPLLAGLRGWGRPPGFRTKSPILRPPLSQLAPIGASVPLFLQAERGGGSWCR